MLYCSHILSTPSTNLAVTHRVTEQSGNIRAHFCNVMTQKMYRAIQTTTTNTTTTTTTTTTESLCFPCCDVINFENNVIFLIKPFFYQQNLKYLENEMSF